MPRIAANTRIARIAACACSSFKAVDIAGTVRTTGCTATTQRTFAPGHDARLKGFLIRAGAEGLLIETPDSNGHLKDAMQVADGFGFGRMVRDGIAAAQKREFDRALRATTRKAPKAKPAPAKVTAKVGRWVYEGTVEGDVFTYTDKRGNAVSTAKFARV